MHRVIWSLSAKQTGTIVKRPGRGGNQVSYGVKSDRWRAHNEGKRCTKQQKVNEMYSKRYKDKTET